MGEVNVGPYGPRDAAMAGEAAEAVAEEQYHGFPCAGWDCVDTRTTLEELEERKRLEAANQLPETVAAQTAGGIAVTGAAIEYMVNDSPKPIDEVLADETEDARANGQTVNVHGATHGGKAGCAALAGQQDILEHGAANVDVLAPIVWGYAVRYGLDKRGLRVEDVVEMITRGGRNAANPKLWQSTAEERSDAIVRAGGHYKELTGVHTEGVNVVEQGRGGFDKIGYMLDHPDPETGELRGAFVATLGELDAYYAGQVERQRLTRREADAKLLGALAWNVMSLTKLSNELMPTSNIG